MKKQFIRLTSYLLIIFLSFNSCEEDKKCQTCNDPPSISDQEFSINENSPINTIVDTVLASDNDEDTVLTYSILAGDINEAFLIESTTGIIRVNDPIQIDYEKNTKFELIVKVADEKGLSSFAKITIHIIDVDDNVEMPVKNLMLYYKFNGSALDFSGNHFDGTVKNVISTSDRNDEADKAYEFNGMDSYVQSSTTIDDSLAGGVTFSAWVYYTGENTGRIVSNYYGEGAPGNCNERIGFVFGITENRLNMFYAIDGNDYIGRMTSENSIQVNQWYHVLGTWDGTFSSGGFKLYIDGVRSDVINQETGYVSCGYLESLSPFYIGMGHCEIGECAPFEGKIDDVRIYSRVLTENEIGILANE